MASMTRHQLRAARALLALQQEVLAAEAGIGVATLRRFESGNDVGEPIVAALRRAVEAQGAVLVAAGTVVDGREVGEGVALVEEAGRPEETRLRLAKLDLTSKEAAAALGAKRRDGTGRRTRSPVPAGLRKVPGPKGG